MKHCPRCNQDKPKSEFFKSSSRKDGLAVHCKECCAGYQRNHYARNQDRYLQKNNAKRDELKQVVRELKNNPCTDCKQKFHYCVMDFDHLSGKQMLISRLISYGSLEKLLAEIAKCELVCANCHRIRTFNRALVA